MSIFCPQCGFDNPAGASFCLGCGTHLEAVCPACGHVWPPKARFCGHCGAALDGEGAGQGQLASPLASERRHVTILFADIAGFTSMAEQFDPETVTSVVNDCFRVLGEVTHRFGGVIDKFMGDSMMVLFGAPKAHEDDPARALHAAMAMRRRLETFNAELALHLESGGGPAGQPLGHLEIHIGINTGEVIAGVVGTSRRQDYTVMGDAVNLAARLQEAAGPGEIYVSEQTYQLTQTLFDYQSLLPLALKGKRAPVHAYRLEGERESAPRRRGLPGLGSPLVGRRREFRLLRRCVDRLVVGEGQVVAVVGEAGIGKSRLVTELRRSASAIPLQWVEGRCLAYGQPVSYGVFVEILCILIQVDPEAPEPLLRQQLQSRLAALFPDHSAREYAYLGHLLNLQLSEEQAGHVRFLDSRSLQQQVFRAVSGFIRAVAEQTPLVLVFEDLHWADAASVQLLGRLIPLTASVPLMILWATRPERESDGWALLDQTRAGLDGHFTQIWLDQLSAREGAQLARNLLTADLDDASVVTQELILSRAGGNPLFMEEVLRSLLDSDALMLEAGKWRVRPGMEVQLPDTLRGVLMARIDHLVDEDRQVLQRASILGRRFPHRLLQLLVDPVVDLDESLMRLQQEEMIRPLPDRAEPAYIFKHVLVQDAAYDSLLLSQRRIIHRRVGEGLERLFADRLDEHYASLAHHFRQGQVWDKAVEYAERAARRAQQTYAHKEALTYYGQALDILPRLGQGARWDRKRFELLLEVERIYDRLGQREDQRGMLAEMKSLAGQLGDDRLLSEAHIREGRYLWQIGDYEAAAVVLEGAVVALRAVEDRARLGRALSNLGVTCWFQSRFQDALGHHQEALQIARAIGDKREQCRTLNNVGSTYTSLGQNEEGIRHYQAGLVVAEETGDLFFQGALANNIAHVHHDRGEFGQARQGYEVALAITRMVGDRRVEAIALANIADMDWRLGEYEASLVGFRASLDLDRSMENEIGQASTRRNIGNVLRVLGRYGEALELLSGSLVCHQRLGVRDHVASDHQCLARLYADLGAYDRAGEHWQECRLLSEALVIRQSAVEAYQGLGEVALARGDLHGALGWLCKAEALSRELELNNNRMHVHNVQAAVYRAMGDLDAAQAEAQQALLLSEVGPTPHGRLAAQGHLVEILLAREDAAAALQTARAVWQELQVLGHFDGSEAALALVCSQAAGAAGEVEEADSYLHWGYNTLMEQAATLEGHPGLHGSFLDNLSAHRALQVAWQDRTAGDDDAGIGSGSANH